jgi:hypothetical protein
MDPVNARLVSLVMMLPDAASLLLSEDPKCQVSWSAWTTKKPTSVMKLKPKEVS